MTDPIDETVPTAPVGPPPQTGHHDIDRALAGLDLGADVATHPESISGVLDAVARALAGPALPQGLRPQQR